jgi:hypothetical protein
MMIFFCYKLINITNYIMNVFYFRITADETFDGCATLMAREDIATTLAQFGFDWIEMTNGQACFESNGNFKLFKQIVEKICELECYNLVKVANIPDPGVGLFL